MFYFRNSKLIPGVWSWPDVQESSSQFQRRMISRRNITRWSSRLIRANRGGLKDSGKIAKYVENVGKLRVQRIKAAMPGTQSGRRLAMATQGVLCSDYLNPRRGPSCIYN